MQQEQANVGAHNEAVTEVLNILVKHNLVTGGAVAAVGRISDALASEFGLTPSVPATAAETGPSREPVISPRKSIHPEYLICLFDGQQLKMLKRYLRTHYNMTPDQYRAHFNLPKDYPMVAPAYSERRSQLAIATGLGVKPGSRGVRGKATGAPAIQAPAPAPTAAAKPKVTHAHKAPAKPKSAPKAPPVAAKDAVQSEAAQAATDLAKSPEPVA
jgi:predicted transcriptional regulator